MIVSFAELFAILEFRNEFKVINLELVQALTWIRMYFLPEPPRIVSRVVEKANGCSKPLEGSNINFETEKVLWESET